MTPTESTTPTTPTTPTTSAPPPGSGAPAGTSPAGDTSTSDASATGSGTRPVARALGALAALALAFGVSYAAVHLSRQGPDDTGTQAATASKPPAATRATPVTTFVGLVPAAGDPELPALATLHPRSGTAVQASGPFDDRFRMAGLRFDGRAVHATVRVTSDVSDVLELAARAGFYDASGRQVGTATWTYHLDEEHPDAHATDPSDGTPNEVESFSIRVPPGAKGRAVSAAVGVTVLVNE